MKRKKIQCIKVLLSVTALRVMFASIMFSQNFTLLANSNQDIYEIGDVVYFADQETVYIGKNGDDLLLLSNYTLADDYERWAVAQTFKDTNFLGNIGKKTAVGTLPSFADLDPFTQKNASGERVSLDSRIPVMTFGDDDWWLYDTTDTNRAYFVGENNRLDKENTINSSFLNADNTCGSSSTIEKGMYLLEEETQPAIVIPNTQYLKEGIIKYNFEFDKVGQARRHTGFPATNSNYLEGGNMLKKYTASIKFSRQSETGPWKAVEGDAGCKRCLAMIWNPANQATDVSLGTAINYLKVGDVISFTVPGRTVPKIFSDTDVVRTYASTSEYTFDVFSSSNAIYYDRFQNKFTGTATVHSITNATYADATCPAVTNAAGLASIRPLIRVPESKILYYKNTKSSYPTASQLTDNPPVSDTTGDRSYLTMETDVLKANLQSGATGVNGNNYGITKPQNSTLIDIPLAFSGAKEGNQYVAMSATDINGNEVYGIVDQVSGTNKTVTLDFANLMKPEDSSFKINLYLIDEGMGETAYRSKPTEVIVTMKKPQVIAFDTNNPTTVQYGDELTLSAKLVNDLAQQSSANIIFTVPQSANGAYKILRQSYKDGIATVTIKAQKGNGSYPIEISKRGDNLFFDADKQTMNIRFTKRPAKFTPQIITGKIIGDLMPSLSVDTDGIFEEDLLYMPPITLEKEDVIFADSPSSNNVDIDQVGTWKMLFDRNNIAFPSSMSDNYDITLEDYNDDSKYVFTVDPDGILDAWIEVSPNANANGWNNTDVIVKPSNQAKYYGYQQITQIIDGVTQPASNQLMFKEETKGMKPAIALLKGSEVSPSKAIRKLKIDKSKPELKVELPSGWQVASEEMVLQVEDRVSGIDSVKVTLNGVDIQVAKVGLGTYSCTITKNGYYTITATDLAGNVTSMKKNVTNIDDTTPSITATLGTLSSDKMIQDIDVERVVGASGIKTLQVLYQGDGDTEFTLLSNLNPLKPTFVYQAKLAGTYKFEMVTNAGIVVSSEVDVLDIVQPNPVVGIDATITTSSGTDYIDGTWTNQDVKLQLKNINPNFTNPVKFQYKKVADSDWIDVEDDEVIITTDTWMNDEFLFQAIADNVISSPSTFTVKIDKVAPIVPKVQNASDYIDTKTFYSDVNVIASTTPKASGIQQNLYYSLDEGGTWVDMNSDTSYLFDTLGKHTIQFKAVDEIGNESATTPIYYIEIKNKEAQTIRFEQNNVTSAIYGTDFSLEAYYEGAVHQQAKTPIIFSLPDASKGKIVRQSYDPTTGIAKADIHLFNGDVFLDVAIDKAGDSTYAMANQETTIVQLNKKALSVYPQIILGKTKLDFMPSMVSLANGLVNQDYIPSELVPELIAIDNLTASSPDMDNDGRIDEIGTWRMIYASDILDQVPAFAKKYDITFTEYDALISPQYVFKVSETGIPDAWLILTPNANANGWNNTDVKVSLAQDAIDAGYHTIALLENGVETIYGNDIVLDAETPGSTPTVVLKTDTDTSDPKTLRLLKLDKTKPTLTYKVENASTRSVSKKVTIEGKDSLSQIASMEVFDEDGNSVLLDPIAADSYSFTTSTEGIYKAVVKDLAGNETTESMEVSNQDLTLPTLIVEGKGLSLDKRFHNVDVTWDSGDSGVDTFGVYYKKDVDDTYPNNPLESLDASQPSFTYKAKQNGWYRFTLVNQDGDKIEEEIMIDDVEILLPVMKVQAVLDDGNATSYTSGKWVNQDVLVTLENVETDVDGTIQYQYRNIKDSTWTDIHDSNHQVTFEEDEWSLNTYEFRGVVNEEEGVASTLTIAIDKEQPDIPNIKDAQKYTSDAWYGMEITLEGLITPKSSGISQTMFYSVDQGITWMKMTDLKTTISTIGQHQLCFKSVDIAGNESDKSDILYVNINDGTPKLSIHLNDNPIEKWINSLSFGLFFKEYVEVEAIVDWYHVENGEVYYIMDESASPSTPSNSDSRWQRGESFSINPNTKAMVYMKAVSGNGKIVRSASPTSIVVDEVAPTITVKDQENDWIKNTSLTILLEDDLAGLNPNSLICKSDGQTIPCAMQGNQVTLQQLKEGEYDLALSVADKSGNTTKESIPLKIDTTNPNILGVKDNSVYKHYYLPRFIEVLDELSGLQQASYRKGEEPFVTLNDGKVKIKEIGSYQLYAIDEAGNEITLAFTIIPLPDIETEIDGSDESKEIIDQIQKEYDETKDQLDETERKDIEEWIDDAINQWIGKRVKVIYTEDKSAKVEGLQDTTFDPKTKLILEDIDATSLPSLPLEAKDSYHVYLEKKDTMIESQGLMKVYLPYTSNEKPVLYEIDEKNVVRNLAIVQESTFITFETNDLQRYVICNSTQDIEDDIIKVPGPDGELDTDDDVIANPSDKEKPVKNPDGTVTVPPGGSVTYPDGGVIETPEGGILNPDGSLILPDGTEYDKDGHKKSKVCQIKNGIILNIDSDSDGLPDLNLDINDDCIADLNIDITNDKLPDFNIDGDGDGKLDINVDSDSDGFANLNLQAIKTWNPNKDCEINGFKYDTMMMEESDSNTATGNSSKNNESLSKNMGGTVTGDKTNISLWGALILLGGIVLGMMRKKSQN